MKKNRKMKKIFLVLIVFTMQINFAQNLFPSSGSVGVGTLTPLRKLTVEGQHHDSSILIHSIGGGDDLNQADLMLWASEPGSTWSGTGIGNNVQNWNAGAARFSLINPARGGSYMRLLDKAISFNIISNDGVDKQVLSVNTKGDFGVGTAEPSNLQGWDKVLDVAGGHHSKIIATVNDSQYRVGIFAHNETWYGGGGFVGTESNHPLHFITNYTAKMSVLTNGNVGIGTIKPDSKLTVAGNIHAQEVKVTVNAGADFVFDKEYDLPSLESVDQFIKENKHLPEIASASQMQENGINLSEMNIKLLQKIEEMTLYMIQQNKEIIDLKSRLDKVEHLTK